MLLILSLFLFLFGYFYALISDEPLWLRDFVLCSVLCCSKSVEAYQLIADHFSVPSIKLSVLLQVSFSLFWAQKSDNFVISCLVRKNFEIELLFKLVHVLDECFEPNFTIKWMASHPPQVVHYGIRFVSTEQLPQVLDQWLLEKCFSFLDCVLIEYIVAR